MCRCKELSRSNGLQSGFRRQKDRKMTVVVQSQRLWRNTRQGKRKRQVRGICQKASKGPSVINRQHESFVKENAWPSHSGSRWCDGKREYSSHTCWTSPCGTYPPWNEPWADEWGVARPPSRTAHTVAEDEPPESSMVSVDPPGLH